MSTPQLAPAPRQAAVLAAIAGLHAAAFAVIVSGLGPRLLEQEPPPRITMLPRAIPPAQPEIAPEVPGAEDYPLPSLPEPIVELPRFDEPPPALRQAADVTENAAGAGPMAPTEFHSPSLRLRDARLAALVQGCYPGPSRRQGEEGRLIIRIDIDSGGRVSRWNIVERSGFQRLDAAADCVVRRLEFHPGRRDGEAVAASVQLPIVFRLD